MIKTIVIIIIHLFIVQYPMHIKTSSGITICIYNNEQWSQKKKKTILQYLKPFQYEPAS